MEKKTKLFRDLSADDFKQAMLNEQQEGEMINVGGFVFKKINTTLEEYAKQIGAKPYNECKISKM